MYYFYPDGHSCCEGSTTKCPDTPCGQCTDCTPLYCVTLASNTVLYNTVLATDINGNPAMGGPPDSLECLHIPYEMGTSPPTDTWVDSPNVSTFLESLFTPGSDFDCDPNYCENYPFDSLCRCHPEEDFKWNGQESVDWVFYYWDYYQGMHTTNSFQNGNMPWADWYCGYQLGGYTLYYTRGVGWTFGDSNGTSWEQYGGIGNIFTWQGNDPINNSYYEIL